ncbi:uncharacterized protein EI90DRAFT_3011043 [Cantharellus anzutake]|uniref:uncharacterized protein n=1 Tax=Cantharellus anzutake TaxID=1750568 RepID=UPI0019054B1F|nr:uncharacterized protein EI90DRAFT_3011043 [Cantharellus anzutake]KAF8344293.1 hypothetical protein EI90DRAFT_3011043 [Cantharellus anzutake]
MPSLPPITLSSLEKGLTALKNNAQPLIDELKAKLASGLSVTEDEEAWLDGSANFTDKALLIAELQHAEDFQSSFDSLSASQKATVQRLQVAGSGNSECVANADVVPEVGCESNLNLKSGIQRASRLPKSHPRYGAIGKEGTGLHP